MLMEKNHIYLPCFLFNVLFDKNVIKNIIYIILRDYGLSIM